MYVANDCKMACSSHKVYLQRILVLIVRREMRRKELIRPNAPEQMLSYGFYVVLLVVVAFEQN